MPRCPLACQREESAYGARRFARIRAHPDRQKQRAATHGWCKPKGVTLDSHTRHSVRRYIVRKLLYLEIHIVLHRLAAGASKRTSAPGRAGDFEVSALIRVFFCQNTAIPTCRNSRMHFFRGNLIIDSKFRCFCRLSVRIAHVWIS